MRPLTCLVCFICLALAGCATTEQARPDERPVASTQKPVASCTSSGGNDVGCAATIAISTIIHSVQKQD